MVTVPLKTIPSPPVPTLIRHHSAKAHQVPKDQLRVILLQGVHRQAQAAVQAAVRAEVHHQDPAVEVHRADRAEAHHQVLVAADNNSF